MSLDSVVDDILIIYFHIMIIGIIHLGMRPVVNVIKFCQIDNSVVLYWVHLFSEVLCVFNSCHLSGLTVICSGAHRQGPSSFKCRILL